MKITSQKGFTGLDERKKLQTSASSATVMENLRITDGGSLTKRPEIYNVAHFDDDINCVWCGNINSQEQIIVASGGLVYRLLPSDTLATPELIGEVGIGDCIMFEFNGFLYIKTHYTYSKYDGTRLYEVAGYIPTVAINCKPSGEGEIFESINLLSDMRKQLFSADGVSTDYKLAEDDVPSVVSVKIDGSELTSGYFYDPTTHQIHFELAPKEGINNIEAIYQKMNSEEDVNRIMKCNKIMLFGGNSDGRAFLWGNEDYPNYRFHSELANGIPSVEYFPINAFTVIGNSKINCIAQQYDRQLIFTKNEAYYSYCELRDDGVGNIVSSFPVYSLNGNKGCLFETDGCNIDNRPVTLCHDGLNMWESTSVVNEKNAIYFSSPIAESMSKILSGSLDDIIMFDFQANRELYFISDSTAYIYNYGNGAWYTYTNMNCEHYSLLGSTLYFSYGKTLHRFSNKNNPSSLPCMFKSGFITNGHNSGRADIIEFNADIYIRGPVTITFGFERSDENAIEQTFDFPEDDEGFRRISFRPSVKRAMPFRFTHSAVGNGRCELHGVTIKTRDKERSSRYGIF